MGCAVPFFANRLYIDGWSLKKKISTFDHQYISPLIDSNLIFFYIIFFSFFFHIPCILSPIFMFSSYFPLIVPLTPASLLQSLFYNFLLLFIICPSIFLLYPFNSIFTFFWPLFLFIFSLSSPTLLTKNLVHYSINLLILTKISPQYSLFSNEESS